jgi:hypothetical protein
VSKLHDDLLRLRSRLAISATLYESDDLDHQRRSVITALNALAEFLEAQDFPPESLPPILRPALALAERENNNLDQMFAQRARGGRPKATLDQHDRTGILAAFANAWLRLNEGDSRPQESKLAQAARKMRGGWFGVVTRSNLKTAREIISQEAKNHPAVVIAVEFDQLFDKAITIAGRAGAFQFMLDFVNNAPAARMKGIWKTPPVSSADKD